MMSDGPAIQPPDDSGPAVTSTPGTDEPDELPSGPSPGDRLIGIGDIRELFGLGRTAAYELTHRPGFPAPVPLSSHAYRWWASEVAAFTETLRTAGQNSPARSRRGRAPGPAPSPSTARLRITGAVRPAHRGKSPR
jgi:predicted DNA-binding transcriptional regulator AlpA